MPMPREYEGSCEACWGTRIAWVLEHVAADGYETWGDYWCRACHGRGFPLSDLPAEDEPVLDAVPGGV